MKKVRVEYDGRYPNLCSGQLIVYLDDERWVFPKDCMQSGGSAGVDCEGNEFCYFGVWSIEDWPEGFPEAYKLHVLNEVNETVEQGCCGGCI